jgi:hypothetical protein
MKFINVIREGDFVRLKTLEQLEREFGEAQEGGVIGALFFGDRDNLDISFFVHENVREELGNVLRIKSVENAQLSDEIFFHAENNGIFYNYDDIEDVVFEKHIVDSVLINGKWYKASDDLNVLLNF